MLLNKFAAAILFATALSTLSVNSHAEDELHITKITESWVIHASQADWEASTPQISNVISPVADLDGQYFILELNHRSLPDFVPGGLQLQCWKGENNCSSKSHPTKQKAIEAIEEVISYDLVLTLDAGKLTCEVTNGKSKTWGEFGGDGSLSLTIDYPHPNLNTYRSASSVLNSGIGRAAHKVTRFALESVNYATAQEVSFTQSTPLVLHKQEYLGVDLEKNNEELLLK